MNHSELQQLKDRALAELAGALPRYRQRMEDIDPRIWQYAQECTRTDIDVHCTDEILALRKFCRFLDTYDFDTDLVHDIIRDAEGTWTIDAEGTPHYTGTTVTAPDGSVYDFEDGLRIDGIYGYGHYRQTPMQVYAYAYIYGFKRWVDTTSPVGSRAMLPTERIGSTGTIEDHRRVVREFILTWPRKVAKSFVGAFIQYQGLIRGDADYEGYIVANSAQQSALLFGQLRKMITQKAGWQKYFRITDSDQSRLIQWREKTSGRRGIVKALTKGPEGKDGLKARTLTADEFGGAKRVKDKCDMEGLINVVKGSFGPEREPLTVHTSTAGLGNATPYELLVTALFDTLVEEMAVPLDGRPHPLTNDWQGGIILRPDPWERDDESLRTERVIRKVNPNLGVTIQADFYAREWEEAYKDGEAKRREVITKLYNVFASDRNNVWITPDQIRELQVPYRITDIDPDEGWLCYIGMDFSQGNDLCAVGYLCYHPETGQWFIDADSWVAECQLTENTLSALYDTWHAHGWLHTSPGRTIDEGLIVERVAAVSEHVAIVGIGYDSYDSKRFKNALLGWWSAQGGDPRQIRPVSQTKGGLNSACQTLQYIVDYRDDEGRPVVNFSENPVIPFCFGNALLVEDAMGNVSPEKSTSGTGKIDIVMTILDAIVLQDESDAKV